jgi:hypothetical protein
MSQWSPFNFHYPAESCPIVHRAVEALKKQYNKSPHFVYNEFCPRASPEFLSALTTFQQETVSQLVEFGVWTFQQINDEMRKYGPNFGGMDQTRQSMGYDFWWKLNSMSNLAGRECEIRRLLTEKEAAAAVSWEPLRTEATLRKFPWGEPSRGAATSSLINMCAARVQLIEEELPKLRAPPAAASPELGEKVDQVVTKTQLLEERLATAEERLSYTSDRLLAVAAVAAHTAAFKSRIEALETQLAEEKAARAAQEADNARLKTDMMNLSTRMDALMAALENQQQPRRPWRERRYTTPRQPRLPRAAASAAAAAPNPSSEDVEVEVEEFIFRGQTYLKAPDNSCWRILPNGEQVWEGVYLPAERRIDRSVPEPVF